MQGVYNDQTEIVLGYGAYLKKSGLLNKLVRWELFIPLFNISLIPWQAFLYGWAEI
jgi:hypothetical protein